MRAEAESIKKMSDRTLHACPLGVRFWDDVLQTVISDGLRVAAYPEGNPGVRTDAVSNPSGVFVFHGLHGMHGFEFREGPQTWDELDPWKAAVSFRPFCIEIRDNRRRFLPFLMKLQAPNKGMVLWTRGGTASSPERETAFVPLFSAPTRSVPPGMAVLRAELWDPGKKRPAASVLLEASFKGQVIAQGFADDKGRIVLIFPYPEPARLLISPPGSPPRNPGIVSLRDQEWRIDLRAFFSPDASVDEAPDLAMVCNQPPAIMWHDQELLNELVDVSLQFGKETILRTEIAGETLPVLYVTSAVSPP